MSLIRSLFGSPQPRALSPWDDRYYTMGPVAHSAAGIAITPDTALQSSAFWACVSLLADCVGMAPLITYERTRAGKQRAYDQPVYEVLHDEPNRLQTPFRWKRMTMVHALIWGNAYSRILPGPRGAVDQLVPLHPDGVRVERLPGGGRRYRVYSENRTWEPVNDEDIYHIQGLAIDELGGLSPIQFARNTIGLALATEQYSGRFFNQAARPSGVLKAAGKLDPAVAKRMQQSWEAAHGGIQNAWKVAVLEEGVEWQQTGMSHEDAQLIASMEWSVEDVARWFRVPLHMIGSHQKSTTWGSGLEQLSLGFTTFTLLPWFTNFEEEAHKRLLLDRRRFFVEFLVDVLLRGDAKSRSDALAVRRQNGVLTADEWRAIENQNPIGGEVGDMLILPVNYVPAQQLGKTAAYTGGNGTASGGDGAAARLPEPDLAGLAQAARLRAFVTDAAARVVRKEAAAMDKAARRTPNDPDGWRQAVETFYGGHATHVAATLHLTPETAVAYVEWQRRSLLSAGSGGLVVEEWERASAERLAALALDELEGDGDERDDGDAGGVNGGDHVFGRNGHGQPPVLASV